MQLRRGIFSRCDFREAGGLVLETVGTDTSLVLISVLIRLVVLGALGYIVYRLVRASRKNRVLRIGLIVAVIILIATLVIGYAYLGALGRGMSL